MRAPWPKWPTPKILNPPPFPRASAAKGAGQAPSSRSEPEAEEFRSLFVAFVVGPFPTASAARIPYQEEPVIG